MLSLLPHTRALTQYPNKFVPLLQFICNFVFMPSQFKEFHGYLCVKFMRMLNVQFAKYIAVLTTFEQALLQSYTRGFLDNVLHCYLIIVLD